MPMTPNTGSHLFLLFIVMDKNHKKHNNQNKEMIKIAIIRQKKRTAEIFRNQEVIITKPFSQKRAALTDT